MSRNSGFTLFELLIVCAIAGGLAGMAAYTMRYTGANHFAVSKATMLDTLTSARNMAHLRAECVVVTIAPMTFVMTTASYTADAGRTCAGPFTTSVKTLPAVDFGSDGIILSALSSGSDSIVFNTLGGLANDNILDFSMTDQHGERATIRIYPAIGQVRVR